MEAYTSAAVCSDESELSRNPISGKFLIHNSLNRLVMHSL